MHSSGKLKKKMMEKMVFTEEGFQSFVEKLSGGGGLKCKFCGQIFAFTTSITRFKWHWSGVEGNGVKVCAQVPTDIQEAAFLAMQQPPKKKHKAIWPSSSNMIGAISTCSQGQINQVGNLVGDLERMLLEQEQTGEEIAPPDAHDDMKKLTEGMTQEIRQDALQATDQVGQVDIENTDWAAIASIAPFMEVDVQNGTGKCVQPVAGASSSASLPCITNSHQTRGDALPTGSTKLVGEAFEEHTNAIWSWLMKDEASLLGIYGMGGVGKTSLVRFFYNQLKKRPNTFPHVYWISISQDFSIYKLQNHIAKHLGLDPANEDDEWERAEILSKEFATKQQPILILDDMWSTFDPETVRIPIQENGCKLILTTRSLQVCREMGCLDKIKVECLSPMEAWILFMENLKHDVALSPKLERIAYSVTMECAGLPLAILAIARSMRGVDDLQEWRNTLEKLKESKAVRDMEHKIFRLLRFSYDQLDDLAQQCFLYCALFPEDYTIKRNELIGYLIDEGIIGRMKSREAEFDEGHSILNKLENASLLERDYDWRGSKAVKMHDLLRDMALQIQLENSQTMVKEGGNLTESLELEEWNVDFVRVSLMDNRIFEISESHSPKCPNLSTLFLCQNGELQFIVDSFFQLFHKLKVLDLSNTSIEILPDSIFDLVTLNGLLLRECFELRCIPSLKKLGALKRLDLRETNLERFPEDMEWLSNLRYLRVGGCGQKKFPIGVLPKLSQLQVFIQDAPYSAGVDYVKGNEVACLRKLEILQCHFEHLFDLGEYLKYRDETQSLSSYALFVGWWGRYNHDSLEDCGGCSMKTVGLGDLSMDDDRNFQAIFPNDMRKLLIYGCDGAASLCDISTSIKNATDLEVIDIEFCDGMESLLPSSWFCSAPLEPLSSRSIFPHLKEVICVWCWGMKMLFPLLLLPNLVNMEHIKVACCDNLEEIIATTGEECSSRYSVTEFGLPKLRSLDLSHLPELTSICTVKLKCNPLLEISATKCSKLNWSAIFSSSSQGYLHG